MQATSQFRDLHHRGRAFVLPNPWDAGSARMLASLGYQALATTSAGMAFSLGLREGRASRAQVLDHCRLIVEATDLPVSADLEHGFGHSPDSAADTIRAAAETGLAGGSIEDHTGNPDDPIYDATLAAERIAAAVEAARAQEHDFVLTARCENHLWGRDDLDDTIARLQAYEAAGADVLYAPGLRDLDTIRTVCSSLTNPVNVIMGLPGCTLDVGALNAAGVARISVGSGLARLAYGTLVNAARETARQGTFDWSDSAMGFAELENLIDPQTD